MIHLGKRNPSGALRRALALLFAVRRPRLRPGTSTARTGAARRTTSARRWLASRMSRAAASYARGRRAGGLAAGRRQRPDDAGRPHLYRHKSRLELQVHGGDTVWLGSRTDLAALNLTEDTKQFALKIGVALVPGPAARRERRLGGRHAQRRRARSRGRATTACDVDADGNTRVAVRARQRRRSRPAADRSASTRARRWRSMASTLRATTSSRSPRRTPWDRWVDDADTAASQHSASYRYVSRRVVGRRGPRRLRQLEQHSRVRHGLVADARRRRLVSLPPRTLGLAGPLGLDLDLERAVGLGALPLRALGQLFLALVLGARGAVGAHRVAYSPALVAFVGGGPRVLRLGVTSAGGGYVGWFPLAPREPFVPWWASPGPRSNVNVTNVTYVNRTYVTVVNQNTFVSGGLVGRNVVTDRTVVRQVETAPVVRGAVPVLPTIASTRVSVAHRRGRRPRRRPPSWPAPWSRGSRLLRRLRASSRSSRSSRRIASGRSTRSPRRDIDDAGAGVSRAAAAPVRPVANTAGNVTLARVRALGGHRRAFASGARAACGAVVRGRARPPRSSPSAPRR